LPTSPRDPAEDVAAFKSNGAQVLVGTPGRMDDMMRRADALMGLRRFEMLVLDEADRLLDMGFRQQLDAIMARLPKQRRTGGCRIRLYIIMAASVCVCASV
jgi:ATP-dependent RNA helicase DDX55/SPB4